MKHQVLIVDSGEHYACDEGESVLEGMARLGRRGIPLGCRGGGCGVCRVRILSGLYQAKVMSRQHVSVEDQASGIVLACRVLPRSELALRVVGKLHKAVCRPAGGDAQPVGGTAPVDDRGGQAGDCRR